MNMLGIYCIYFLFKNYNSQIQILKKYDNQLWNFDNSQLLIRPYFRSLRKRIQIKSGASNILNIKESLKKAGYYYREQLQFEEEIYQADKNLIKLALACQSEQYADEIFTYLMSNKSNLQIDSVMMQSRNYLDEFHKNHINWMRMNKDIIENIKILIFQKGRVYKIMDNKRCNIMKIKRTQEGKEDLIEIMEIDKIINTFKKGIQKNVNQKTPKQQVKLNPINQNDFPRLDAQQN